MPKKVDLTDKVFGHLKVLHEGEPYISPKGAKQRRWVCECDCGKIILTNTHNLTSGQTKSCGHARLDYLVNKSPIKDLTGKVFGHLKVIKDDGTRQRRAVKWLCQCDCGKQTHVLAKDLEAGTTTSCGHVRDQVMKKSLADYREKYKRETPRLVTESGFYITANRENVRNWYYVDNPKAVKIVKATYLYKDKDRTKRIRKYGKGTVFTITGVIRWGDIWLLKTESGFYITANKDFVQKY